MSERTEKGLWPHPPIKYSEIVDCLIRTLESEKWFPFEWKPTDGEPVYEGGIIERLSSSKYIYRSHRHHPNAPTALAEENEKVFKSARKAVEHYLKWDLHLPGDLDGWTVKF